MTRLSAVRPVDAPPAPPEGLSGAALTAWEAFWRSPVAAAVDTSSDLPALHRLFGLYEERERAFRGMRRRWIVAGSTGQPSLNPLAKYLAYLDDGIRALEDRFGLTPMARLKLGIAVGEARRSLEELNLAIADEDGHEDPRLELAESAGQ